MANRAAVPAIRAVDDRTEIVSRPLPYAPPIQRRLIWLLAAVAFAAACAVFLTWHLLARRQPPAPTQPVPPVVVIPQPTVEKLSEVSEP